MNRYLWRWLTLVLVCALGYWSSLERSLTDGAAGGLPYTVTAVAMGLVMFLGIEMQNRTVLPIHDREVDWIIGTIALVLAVSARAQLAPRLVEWFDLLRLDMLSLIIFAFGVSALVFGSRATLRFGSAWATLLLFNSPVFLIVSLLCGGGWTGTACAASVGLAVAAAAAGNRVRHRAAAAGVTLVVGVMLTLLTGAVVGQDRLREALSGAAGITSVLPALAGVLTALAVDAAVRHTLPTIRHRDPSVRHTRAALVPLTAAVAVLLLVPLPERPTTSATADAPGTQPTGTPAPAGWSVTGSERFAWTADYFGAGADFRRQVLRADAVVDDWDTDNRHRTVVVDTLTSDGPVNASRFGDEGFYSSVNGRRSPKLDVGLGHGVTGRVYTVLDDEAYLTYTRLRVSWRDDGGRIHDISVIAVDDHRDSAVFPAVTGSLTGLAGRIVTVLLRGGAVTEDPDADYKDLDVVTAVATGIVDARWEEGQ
ncbi:hypothetical protein [Corynebacterium variabile]|uniref:Uncharacterized protein n=1 Tax=Corynebacterium variabile TaxID=1727 RepID=A0A0X2NLD4_9CORY|nr:hypothetical protein [Corynebacterium variabile]CUU66297.1 hypothetical protein CVAR292_01637 [Corynebacterium variabile]